MKKLLTVAAGLAVATAVGCTAQQVATTPDSTSSILSWSLTNPPTGAAVQGATLYVMLAPELDREGADIISKKNGFTKVELLKPDGTVFKTATLKSTQSAEVSLTGLTTMADYFLRFNGKNEALVPTRIMDPAQPIFQYVGARLQRSVIGDLSDPTFVIKVYSQATMGAHYGKDAKGVVKFTDGKPTSQYSYFVSWPKSMPRGSDWAELGTGKRLGFKTASTKHEHDYHGWILGDNNHGKIQQGQKEYCNTCHGPNLTNAVSTEYNATPSFDTDGSVKWDKGVTSWWGTSTSKGFCFKCHYGPEGDRTGLVDPTK